MVDGDLPRYEAKIQEITSAAEVKNWKKMETTQMNSYKKIESSLY